MAKGETDKEIWTATIENINDDFEDSRRCLLNSYHSYVQTHSGYIISLIIGASVIISTFGAFFESLVGIIIFSFLIVGMVVFSIIMVFRIFYWTTFANIANAISIDDALKNFNKYNEEMNKKYKRLTYFSKAPNTAIIQHAIVYQIQTDFNIFPGYYQKLVLRNIRPSELNPHRVEELKTD